jgi:hypothetical protein
MRLYLIPVFLLVFCLAAKGQKTVREDIWSAHLRHVVMTATFSVNEKDEKSLEFIHLMASDNRYSQIFSPITLFSGSPKECILWFKKLIDFIEDEDVNTSIKIDNQSVSVHKTMGQKVLSVSEWDGGSGFRWITQNKLESGLEKLEEWISEKKIDIYKEVPSQKVIISEPNSEKQVPKAGSNSIADELTKLKNLMDQGVLTKEEFEAQKKKLLGQ